jgi:hypothetical protein
VSERLTCQVCNQPKASLKQRQSKLEPGIKLLVCQSCVDSKFEPRGIIIIHGRMNGPESVSRYIAKRLYVGREITAAEIMKP